MSTDRCICGRPLPVDRPGSARTPAKTCSYWCDLVVKGTFTLAQVEPMLARIREPIPADPDTLPLEAS